MNNGDGIEEMHRDLIDMRNAIDDIVQECVHMSDGSWAIRDGDGMRLCPPSLCKALDNALRAAVGLGTNNR